ncbi:unnamed protein product [Mytilus coruscus]|uniref:CTCK domain-containing protein n=1 Tax=Mytilus coruscus TaxID=42192 RepID=A0A6J8D2Q1_MYTCO|nr:unnamed protein product [Mytilus coruscus]
MNSTRDNTSTQDSGEMMCASQYRKRSIFSNGDCSSAKPNEPFIEPVCIGRCVPKGSQPIELFTGQHYRCKPDKKVTKTVKLLCSGTSNLKSIKVRVVESCKCVLTKKKRRKHKKGENRRRKNKTDNKNKKRKERRKLRGRNRRKQRKNKKSSKLTNNDR